MKRIVRPGLVSLAVLLAACGGGATTPAAFAHKTPAQILTTALAAARRSGSFRYQLVSEQSGTKQSIVGDASTTEGREVITAGGVMIQAEVIDHKAYIEGNQSGLQSEMGFSSTEAASIAGKWISVSTTDSPYASITAAVILPSALTELEPAKPLSVTAATTRQGQQVVGVRGSLPGANAKTVTGSVVFYVSTGQPSVPLAFDATETSSGKQQSDVGTFSRWGESVNLAVPTGTVALSSLSTGAG